MCYFRLEPSFSNGTRFPSEESLKSHAQFLSDVEEANSFTDKNNRVKVDLREVTYNPKKGKLPEEDVDGSAYLDEDCGVQDTPPQSSIAQSKNTTTTPNATRAAGYFQPTKTTLPKKQL